MKKIMVTGSSGYVGNYIIKTLARRHPDILVVGMSRSGQPREEETANLQNVEYVRGDCLEPDSFREHLRDVDGVIHCVGTLIEKRNNPKLSYDAMNRDSAINVAAELQEIAEQKKEHRTFVLLSSEKAPPFLDKYLTSKMEAEQYIMDECPNLNATVVRPGFIVNKAERWWSIPLSWVVDAGWWVGENVNKKMPFGTYLDFLYPAKSVQLSTVAHFSIEGARGNLGDAKVIRNQALIDYDNAHRI